MTTDRKLLLFWCYSNRVLNVTNQVIDILHNNKVNTKRRELVYSRKPKTQQTFITLKIKKLKRKRKVVRKEFLEAPYMYGFSSESCTFEPFCKANVDA